MRLSIMLGALPLRLCYPGKRLQTGLWLRYVIADAVHAGRGVVEDQRLVSIRHTKGICKALEHVPADLV